MIAAARSARGVARALVALVAIIATTWSLLPAQAADPVVERTFEDESWTDGLVDLRSLDLSRTQLIGNGFAGGALKVRIPPDGFRGLGPFDRLEPARHQVWFRYHVRLLNWNAASTGKLPGLAGIYSSSGRGCIPSSPSEPGWSARGMFGVPGTEGAPPGEVPIGTYLYHVDQEGSCGDGLWWGASLEQGRWHCVEGYVRMNNPGRNNGILRGWLDGKLELERGNIEYRRAGERSIGVRHMWHNVYFGGSWPTPNALALEYDEVAVSASGRVGCLPPFTDVGATSHREAIVELHALGHLYGCDYRKACPSDELTRGEVAAFLSRTLHLTPAKRDFFRDDEGSTFEGVINRIAAAGLVRGCSPGRFCPDRVVTRAEFATMLGRALDLRGDAPDAFDDDNGHTAEDDIDRFAAAGLTTGCGHRRFCPDDPLPRDESAAFFYRSLRLLEPPSQSGISTPPDFPPPGDPPPIPPEEQD